MGVALAAGIKGDSAVALRTTVLVTVVLTMVVFGGTTSRMIEIVGIKTGVEDEVDTSDEEAGGFVSIGRNETNRSIYQGSRHATHSLGDTLDHATDVRVAANTTDIESDDPYNHFTQTSGRRDRLRSSSPEHSFATQDSDDEVLPAAGSTHDRAGLEADENGADSGNRKVWRDGQWFTVLDEQYLLPVFSNATASRKQASRKALRNQRVSITGYGEPMTSAADQRGSDGDLAGSVQSSQPPSPWLSSPAEDGGHHQNHSGGAHNHHHPRSRIVPGRSSAALASSTFQGSFSDVLSALVNYPPGSSTTRPSLPSSRSSGPHSLLSTSDGTAAPARRKERASDDGIDGRAGLRPSSPNRPGSRLRATSPTPKLFQINDGSERIGGSTRGIGRGSYGPSSAPAGLDQDRIEQDAIPSTTGMSKGMSHTWTSSSLHGSGTLGGGSDSPAESRRSSAGLAMNHVRHRSGDRTGVGVEGEASDNEGPNHSTRSTMF